MSTVIAAAEEATPQWLTAILRREGVLPQGAVVAVARRANDAFNSAITHLDLTYSADAPPAAPRALFLKRSLGADWAVRAGAREVAFYRLVASLAADLPMLARCYDAAHDPASGASHLLLRDLSDTHAPPLSRERIIALDALPAPAHLDGVIEALAGFHAFWWEHPALGTGPLPVSGRYAGAAAYDRFTRDATDGWARFIAAEGDWFPADLRALYAGALARLPALWDRALAARIAARRRLTLSNGDGYFSQYLCPRESGRGPTYIVDFQDVRADSPAIDLTYLCAAFWTPAFRREGGREEGLLRRYHRALLARGVAGYGWDDLLADYRLALALMIFLPVWDQTNGSSRGYWWPKLQCLTGAYRDWRCAELPGGAG